MRKGLLGCVAALFTGAGLALAQPAPAPSPLPAAQPPQWMPGSGAPMIEGSPGPSCGSGGCCAEPCCNSCGKDICGPPGRIWVSAEYLLWWIKDGHVPPLVTAGPPGSLAILGAPGTTTLVGGDLDNGSPYQGGRFTVGGWLNDCQTLGVEGSYFFLGSRSRDQLIGSSGTAGSPDLSVPFFNVTSGLATGFEDVDALAVAGVSRGSVNVSSSSSLQGAGANGLCNLCCCCDYRVDFVGGFRYMRFDDHLGITENSTVFPTVPFIGGTNLIVSDRFDTKNDFYGGQLGLQGEVRRGNFFVNGRTVLGIGDNHQTVDIRGSTIITRAGGASQTFVGGNLAEPTNIGHYTRDKFSFIPEVGANLGYQVTENLRVFVGYTFLYWTSVVRPGDQIDRAVNITQSPVNLLGPGTLVGPARPAFTFHDTDFWAQGVNVGMEFRY